jgi:hypothetical protein
VIGYIEFWDPLLPNDAGPRPLTQVEAKAVNNLFDWVSAVALPGSEFASDFDETADFSDGRLACNENSQTACLQLANRYCELAEGESLQIRVGHGAPSGLEQNFA